MNGNVEIAASTVEIMAGILELEQDLPETRAYMAKLLRERLADMEAAEEEMFQARELTVTNNG